MLNRDFRRTAIRIAVGFFFVFQTVVVYGQAPKVKPVETITVEELRDHVFYLASDALGGRVSCTAGYDSAAQYAARDFRKAGIKPILKDAQGNPTFLQPVPFLKRNEGDAGRLTVRTAEGEDVFIQGEDFKFLSYRPVDFPYERLPVVFVGYGIEEPGAGWNDFDGLDLLGKFVLMLPGAPQKGGKPALPDSLDRLYSTGRGDGPKLEAVFKRGAKAVLILTNSWRKRNWDKFSDYTLRMDVIYAGEHQIPQRPGASARRRGNQIVLREHIFGRLMEDQAFSAASYDSIDVNDGYKTFELRGISIGLKMEFSGGIVTSANAVGMVEGTDPKLKDEYITVGAHLDHVGPRSGEICNGADDNASGSAGVLEVAEAVAMNPPKRSVVFVLYTAEERGLHGSRQFLDEWPFPKENILVNINLDMIGRTDKDNEKTRAHYAVGWERIPSNLKEIIESVNEKTVQWPLVFKKGNEIRGGSDHMAFQERGIPAFFFFSGMHEDLHKPTDDADKIEYDKMQKISQLVYELTMALANGEERLQKTAVE